MKDSIQKIFSNVVVTPEDIAIVIASWTSVPVTKVTKTEAANLLQMEDEMNDKVVGQPEAINAICSAMRRARAGIRSPRRPIACLMFAGPTGCGKTELAKVITYYFFDDPKSLVRFDMSEYVEKHSVSKLVGSPPGYVGYKEGGKLTEAVRRRPYSVVLFDEIEKAHRDMDTIFLQVFEDGRLTDARGRLVDFKNTIIILTSNIGANLITERDIQNFPVHDYESLNEHYGECGELLLYEALSISVKDYMKGFFRPEFLNRLDDIIIFNTLSRYEIELIGDIMVKDLEKRMEKKDIKLEMSPYCLHYIHHEGFNPAYGARPLRRAFATLVEDRLSEHVLLGNFRGGDTALFMMNREKDRFVLGRERNGLIKHLIRENDVVQTNMFDGKTRI